MNEANMGETELVFDAKEITRFRLRCDHCKTDVTFNGEANEGPSEEVRCPNCNYLMAGVFPIAKAYRMFLRALRETSRPTSFVVTLKDDA